MLLKNISINNKKNNQSLAYSQRWMVIASICSYIFFYTIFYIRNTYFTGTQEMRFPVDILSMSPAANDLWACVTKAGQIIETKKIVGVQNVYSPFSVLIFNLFSYFNFETIRIGSYLLTGFSVMLSLFYAPKYFQKSIWESTIGIFILALIFLSYGLRFELERGQINEFVFILALCGSFIAKSKNKYLVALGYLMLVFATQMKVWPLFFVFCYYDKRIKLKDNIYRLLIFGMVNLMLLFSLGYNFFITYIQVISSSIHNQSNVWVANMSLYAFKLQLFETLGIPLYFLSSLNLFIIIVYLIALFFGLKSNQYNQEILLIYHSVLAGLLLPNISFDYKLNVFSLTTFLFYVCYEETYYTSNIINYSTDSLKLRFNINWYVLIERLLLLVPLLVFPITLFSYVYKLNYGILIASNTLPLVAVLLATSGLLFLNSKQRRNNPLPVSNKY